MRKLVLMLSMLLMICSVCAGGTYPQIINVAGRQSVSLDGDWNYVVDQQLVGYRKADYSPLPDRRTFFADRSFAAEKTWLFENTFDGAPVLKVPGDWNTQSDRLYYYEGCVWYRRGFDYVPKSGKRVFLYFGAVNYKSEVALNGKRLGTHEGGFTPFNFEVTGLLRKGLNSVVVLADNTRSRESAPSLTADWWNYGGITRSVCLVEVPEIFVRDYFIRLDGEQVVAEEGKRGKTPLRRICGRITVDGAGKGMRVRVVIPELDTEVTALTDEDGVASFYTDARPQLWSPDNPKLYDVEIMAGEDRVCDRIGFRYVKTDGDRLLLNGKRIFCRGVCLHEEAPFTSSRITSVGESRQLLEWAKEMNCNFVRLAHYPYNEEMIRLAEEMGLLVWEEIPLYWSIDWANENTYSNASAQLDAVLTRDINRANVIIWSVANETPVSAERNRFLQGLISQIRRKDPSRLVSAAVLNKVKQDNGIWTIEDPITEYTDILSFNIYMGWYTRMEDFGSQMNWEFSQDKPVFISEFGGGAVAGHHGDVSEYFTEERMEYVYKENIKMFSRMPSLCGTMPWILMDFRSPRRPMNGIQDEYNRKGLVSEKGQKKKAFYVMQEWYDSMK